jgi:hypothetical protein
MRVACLAIALAFTSCGGEPEPTRPAPPTTETAQTTPPSTEVVAPSADPLTVEPPGPAPTFVFTIAPETTTVGISIANHGTADVRLRSSVTVEVESGGTFAAAPSSSTLTLRYDCSHEPEDCVTLAPGAELLPPSWLGTWGDMQCVCTRCGPVEPGSYRLVVTTCDGAHRIESNPLTLPLTP